MTDTPISIIRSGGLVTMTTDDAMGLVLLEAARRDLNAMSQALGGGSELRARYAGYATALNEAAAQIPRVDLPSGRVAEAVQKHRDSIAGQPAKVVAVRPSDLDEGQPLREEVDELWDVLVERQSEDRLNREHIPPVIDDVDLGDLLG